MKIKVKISTKCFKITMTDLGEFFLSTFGQIVCGTKCDRDKPFFSAKKGVHKIKLGIKRDPVGWENVKKGSQLQGSSLPPSRMGGGGSECT